MKFFEGIFGKPTTPAEESEKEMQLPTIEEMEANEQEYLKKNPGPANFENVVNPHEYDNGITYQNPETLPDFTPGDVGVSGVERKPFSLGQEDIIEYKNPDTLSVPDSGEGLARNDIWSLQERTKHIPKINDNERR